MIEVRRADKYGFCSGVRIAVHKVRQLARSGQRADILGQVVHNERVVREMEQQGLQTVTTIEQAAQPTIVFSAHGVPSSYHDRAREQGLHILDTTCKFVYAIHHESRRALADGMHLVFIGDPQHREVIGYSADLDPGCYHVISTLDQARAVDWSRYPAIRVFFQTTLNASDYERNPPTLDPKFRDYSAGIYRLDEKLLVVLDVNRLLDYDRVQAA